VNVGDKFIGVHNPNASYIEILKEQFFNSVREKRIQVLKDDLAKTINEELNSKLSSASGNAINEANYRYEVILYSLMAQRLKNIVLNVEFHKGL
jgi:hypothetical protein